MSSDIGISRKQVCFAVLEDVTGTLKFPSGADYVLPAGNAVLNQNPSFVDSEELRDSLDVLDQFQNATPAGDFTVPMYVRPAGSIGGTPQGHAMFVSMQGSLAATTATIGSGFNATVATLTYSGVPALQAFPDAGVILVGTEQIAYTGKTAAGKTSGTLTGLTRGYNSTSAAAATAGAAVSIASEYYLQQTTSPSFSLWVKTDHFLQGMSGCSVNQAVLGVNNEGAVMFTMNGQGMRMVWAGRDALTAQAATSATQLVVNDSDRYSAGAYIQNITQADTNAGAGYLINRVDTDTNIINVAAIGATWATGDVIEGYLPTGVEIGSPIESRYTAVTINGVAATFKTSDLTFDVPKQYITDEVGTTFPQAYLEDTRQITSTLNLYFRKADAKYFAEGFTGNEVPVKLVFGTAIGSKMVVYMPKVKLEVPKVEFASPAVNLSMPMKALGTLGEDSAQLVFE